MKKIANLASAFALSAALCLGCASAAFGATVVFEGPDAPSAFSVEGGTGYHATDLFEGLKDVMPGDSLSQEVTIENAHSEAVRLYLAAVPHDEAGNPLAYSEGFEAADGKDQGKNPEASDLIGGEGEHDETVVTMADFLAQLTMRVYSGSELIYGGSPEGMASSAGALLGELAPGATLALTVELDVPATLSNEYAYRVGEVDWVITGEEVHDPDPKLPATGDSALSAIAPVAFTSLLALAVAIYVLRKLAHKKKAA